MNITIFVSTRVTKMMAEFGPFGTPIRSCPVALKTGRTHRNITVTSLTELTFIGNRYRMTLSVVRGMTINTLGQTVFDASLTVSDSVVSAMLEVIHVIPTHQVRRSHTAPKRSGLRIFGYIATLREYLHGGRKKRRQQKYENAVADESTSHLSSYSPNPIWI
jgi:hypothetical protein